MTILKCKMCGGDIEATGATHGVCQHCGLEITLPKIDDDIRGEFYIRGNYFRQLGDFDKAYSEFEHIIAGDATDAEAYWSLLLCRYGITYEQNPKTGEFEIIVNTMRREPVFESIDYRKALENSDEYTKELYRKEAKKIDNIQDKYFSVVRETEPYEVFICFNDMGAKAESKAYNIAETINQKLTEKGVRVFMGGNADKYSSRTDYEAQVYHALNSSKIMFVVSAKTNDLLAPSVKNQWARFSNIISEDRSKKIVPVYSSIDMYDIPEQIPTHESICADEAGYWQDLTRGVLELLGKLDAPKNSANPYEEFIKQAKEAFETGNYLKAELMADQALTHNSESATAYYYLLLAKNKVSNFNGLLDVHKDWKNDCTLNGLLKYGSDEQKKTIHDFLIEYTNRTCYNAAKDFIENEEYTKAIEVLNKIVDYRDSSEIIEECKRLAYHQKQLRDYNAEVNNNSLYHVYNKINKEHNDVINKVRRMVENIVKAPRMEFKPYKALLTGLLFVICGVLANFMDSAAHLFILMGVQCIIATVYTRFVKGKDWIALVFVLPVVIVLALFPNGIGSFIYALLSLNEARKENRKRRRLGRYIKNLEIYKNETVTPLENQIIQDLYNRYESLTPQEIGEFYGIIPLISDDLGYRPGC